VNRNSKQSSSNSKGRIGLVAGWGRYPFVVAEALKYSGYEVYTVGIKGHADSSLADVSDGYCEVGLARIGAVIRYLRRQGVEQATLAGKIHKVVFFQRFAWLGLIPDLTTIRTFYPHFISGRENRNDDSLLLGVVDAFERGGVMLAPATDFAPELFVDTGTLSSTRPTHKQQQDIAYGWQLAKEMGRLDIGQSVAVKGRAMLAIEAIEGTDKCIERAGQLCRQGGFAVIKVAKPQQDMRFDVPTIGIGTLQTLVDSGGSVLAFEANRTIMLDQAEMIDFANRHKLVVVSVDAAAIQRKVSEAA
jgi:DUF1009 family protein